jgi:hypothetical protein
MHIKQTHKANTQSNLLKEHVSQTHVLTEEINNETPTMYIKNKRNSSNIRVCSLFELCKACALTNILSDIKHYE